MKSEEIVRATLAALLNEGAREALASLDAPAIDPTSLAEYWARLRFSCPAFLPFATYQGAMLGIHLWPGRSVESSPIYYLGNDEQSAQFVCSTLADLPIGIWLWVAQYFKERKSQLQEAVTKLKETIPSAREVPAQLWNILDTAPEYEPTWWNQDASPATREAWQVGAVKHPFVDVPTLRADAEPDDAIATLGPYVAVHPDAAPEILAALLAAQRKAKEPRDRQLALRVLSAEAECGELTAFNGIWRLTGEGLAEWDSTLRSIEAPTKALKGTHFEPLAKALDTYTGTDSEGPARLIEIAGRFRAAGDAAGELRQLRNAAWLEAMSEGEVSAELCTAIAESADRVAPSSLAAALARACAATPTTAA